MNIFSSKRANSAAFQLNPVAAGCAVFLSVLAGSAYAQEAAPVVPAATTTTAPEAKKDEPVVQSVVVSGIRRGIEAAISVKRNSNSIVEAISAEDIGKLPDSSVAESIARLPGVTAQRSRNSGKASEISVRGLAPSFNGSLLNNRETASTGNSRSPEFDLFPAELVGGVQIYKTPDAQLIGSGLAATINLDTLKPLDFGKRFISVSARKSRIGVGAEGEEGDGDRVSLSYVDQFMNRTIGVAFGLTKYKENGGSQQKFDSWGGFVNTVDYNGAQVKTPGGFKSDTEVNNNDRDGASLTLQYRPNKSFKTSVDMFYSSGGSSLKRTGLEGAVGGSAGGFDPNGVLSNAIISGDVATSGTFSNYKGVIRNHLEASEDSLKSVGWNAEYKVADWRFESDLAYSRGIKDSSRYETTAGQPGDATSLGTISYTGFNGSNFDSVKYTTSVDYADRSQVRLTDVNGWGGGVNSPQAGYVALPHIDDKVNSIRLSAHKELSFGPVAAAHFGINQTKRDKARTGNEGRLVIKGGANGYASAAMPGNEVTAAGVLGLPVATWDPSGSLGSVYDLVKWVDASVLAKDWSVSEKITTAYAMGDLDGTMFGMSYRGNFGVQVVRTNQQSTGNEVDLANCTGITEETCKSRVISGGTSYTDVLPSLNVNFDVGNDQLVRVGLAKVISRANLDDMRASKAFGINNNGNNPILVGTGGNPDLKPFSAKTFDLAYEKYFGKKGYISAAAFYKKLDTYIFRAPRAFDFAPFVTANTPLPTTGEYAGSTIGLLTNPTNGDGGNIHGFELAVNVPFSMVSSYLDGFGMMVNHSDTKSAITLPAVGFANSGFPAATIPLPGLSRKVSNLRLYYEKHGFQIAAAARKRSDFLGQVSDFQDNVALTFIRGETLVDYQIAYEFQSGFLKGASAVAQIYNATSAPFQEYTTNRDIITNKVASGRTYQFGLNYKF
jgi:iron complex outermembrane receptor protein